MDEIILDRDHYDNQEEFQAALASLIQILTDNHYQLLVSQDSGLKRLFSVKFLHDPQSEEDDWGCDRFMQVTSEEEDALISNREAEKERES